MALRPYGGEIVPIQKQDEPAPEERGFLGDVSSAFKRKVGQTQLAAGRVAQDLGIDAGVELKDAGLRRISENRTKVNELSDIPERPAEFAANVVGESAGDVVNTGIGAGIGAGIGGAIGKRFGMGRKGAELGAKAGAFLTSGVQSYGGIREEQEQEGIDDVAGALLGAGASALLETKFGPEGWVGDVIGGAAKRTGGVLANAGKRAAQGAVIEAPTEILQSGIEQVAAHQNPLTSEGVERALFEGAMGAGGGAAVGGAFGALEPKAAPRAPATAEEMMRQLATGEIPDVRLEDITPGAAQNEGMDPLGPIERSVAQAPVLPPAPAEGSPESGQLADGLQNAGVSADPGERTEPGPVAGVPVTQPGPPQNAAEVQQTLGFIPDPAKGVLNRAVDTGVKQGIFAGSAIVTPDNAAAQPNPDAQIQQPGPQPQPAQQPVVAVEQQPRQRTVFDTAQRAPEDAEQQRAADSPSTPRSRVQAEPQFEERMSAIGRPFKDQKAAEAFSRNPKNAGFKPFKRDGAWVIRREIPPPSDLPPAAERFNNTRTGDAQAPAETPAPRLSGVAASLPADAASDPVRAQQPVGGAPAASAGSERSGVIRQSISPAQARSIKIETKIPDDPDFRAAVAATPGAEVTDEGLMLDVTRYQKDDQEGAQSVRTGVFYLPSGASQLKHYRTPKNNYGGTEKHRGQTLVRRPLVVKAATGGKAPEAAYELVAGKGALKKLDGEIREIVHSPFLRKDPETAREMVRNFLSRNGADPNLTDHIISNSKRGNQLRYALQENVIAHAVRKAGYDAVVSHRAGKITELFDVRETTYPSSVLQSQIHPSFQRQSNKATSERRWQRTDDNLRLEEAELRANYLRNGSKIGRRGELKGAWEGYEIRVVPSDNKGMFAVEARKIEPDQSNKATGWSDRPAREGAKSVVGIHYTNTAGLQALDGSKYGTNHAGAEKRRLGMLRGEKRRVLSNRVYFYPEGTPLSQQGESMVGRAGKHRVQLDNIYDIVEDPLGLKAKADKPGSSDDQFFNELEWQIVQAGFDGYVNPRSQMLVTLGTKPIPVAQTRQSNAPEAREAGGGNLRAEVLRNLYAPITAKWGIRVNVVETPEQFPAQAKSAPGFDPQRSEAVIIDDNIYIAASQVDTLRDAYRLLAHEGVAHAGLERSFGERWPEMRGRIAKLAETTPWINEAVQLRYPGANEDTIAAEALAIIAETGHASTVLSRAITTIRALLRSVGFNVDFSERDIREMLVAAARGMSDGNGTARFSNAAPGIEVEEFDLGDLDFTQYAGLSQDERNSQTIARQAALLYRALGTDSPFFRKWFGDSKMRKENGQPIKLYHATNADFEAFDLGRRGESTGYAASGLGIFMNPKRSRVERYGDKTLTLYASIKKPYRMSIDESSSFETVEDAARRRAELAAQGYDGIIVKEDLTVIAFYPHQVKAADNVGTFEGDQLRFSNRAGPVVNIGLNVNDGSKLTKEEAIAALESTGARVVRSRIKESNTEPTLIAKLNRGLRPDEAAKVSEQLRQDAIAQLAGPKTGLYGPRADQWGSFNKGFFLRFSQSPVQTVGRISKFLTDDELGKLRRDTAQKMVDIIKGLPSAREMSSVALAGKAKRGWYADSAAAILRVFGYDAPRFAGLLAATSPQTSVENNLLNALNIWKNWNAAGRPTDRQEIVRVMGRSVQGNKGEQSVLGAWINNSVRALTEEPETVVLSGPKVNSFMLNLRGFVNEVTNDAWIANYALVDQQIFGGSLTKGGDPGKGPGYLAMSARTRQAADNLTKMTGEVWTPAEVQETVWSWAKTAYELSQSNGEERSVVELVRDAAVTDELIGATPAFGDLFNEAQYATILRSAGYQLDGLGDRGDGDKRSEAGSAQGKAAKTAGAPEQAEVERAARRLDKLAKQRAAARLSNKPAFYSALLRAVESGQGAPKTAPATAWKQWLDGAQRRGEIKQAERDWLGVDAWLDRAGGQIGRAELATFVRENQVEVEDYLLGSGNPVSEELWDWVSRNVNVGGNAAPNWSVVSTKLSDIAARYENDGNYETADEYFELSSEAMMLAQDTDPNAVDPARATKFDSYTLPGGENYRELLLTLPWAYKRGGDGREEKTTYFESSHYDKPNILAHVRFNERTDADGKRVLFVEEVQSDWHQAGRRSGYKAAGRKDTTGWTARKVDRYGEPYWRVADAADAHVFSVPFEKAKTEGEAIEFAATKGAELVAENAGMVPDAPLKKEWPLTVMKRMIRWAAENGFDRIAWTTGDQQNDRYDLSKQVASIEWTGGRGDGSKSVTISPIYGNDIEFRVSKDGVVTGFGGDAGANEGKRLDEVVGKDVADKIMEQSYGSLAGDGLKVGGSGMRGFYDKMLPTEVSKYVKQWGAKVGTTAIPVDRYKGYADYKADANYTGGYAVFGVKADGESVLVQQAASREDAETRATDLRKQARSGEPQPSIDITPAMRAAALDGQPLFSNKPTVGERLQDYMRTSSTFNWWHRSVGTQYHKAQVDDDFRPVFEQGQAFLSDISRIAMETADRAPHMLPRLEGLRDILRRGPNKQDRERVSNAIFTGTLADQRVYMDSELRARFKFNDRQVKLYREARAAIEASLDELNASEISRLIRADVQRSVIEDIRRAPRNAAQIATTALQSKAATPSVQELIDGVNDRADKIRQLKDEGYAPLMRFGKYTVYVTDQNGDQIYFGTFERESDANRMARDMKELYPKAKHQQGVMAQDSYQMFKGLSLDTLELFAEKTGMSAGRAAQDFLRLAKNNRSALKRLIHRKGVAGFDQDVARVLASFVTSNARAASTNYNMGDMTRSVARIPKEKGDVVDEATRLMMYLQNPQEEAAGLRNLLFIQFLGGSIASAALNMTQPATMSFPWLSQFAGAGRAASALAGASKIAVTGKTSDAKLAAAIKRATEEGIVAPHEIHQLYAESIRNFGSHPAIRKALTVWGSLFSLGEAFNRRMTFAAAYQLAEKTPSIVSKGGFQDAYDFAVNAVEATQGIYNKGNRPNWARGAIGATLFTFKQYSIAYMEFLKRLPAKEKALALSVLVIASGLQGLPGADDLEDIIDTLAQSLGYNFNSKRELREAAVAALGEEWGEYVTHGFSAGTPFDVQQRMGLGNLIPGTALLQKSNRNKTREVTEVLGPVGGLIQQVMDAYNNAQEGNLWRAALDLAPLAVKNVAKGAEMAATGAYPDKLGRKVTEATDAEAAIKGVGFQPQRVARVQRNIGELQQQVDLARVMEAEIADQWAKAIAAGDNSAKAEAAAKLRKWNGQNPEWPIRISSAQLKRRVQQLKMSKEQRFLKAAPKELRGSLVE